MSNRSTQDNRRALQLAVFAALTTFSLVVTSCSSGDDATAPSQTTAPAETDSDDPATTAAAELDNETDPVADPEPEPQVFELIATEPTEPGPRPMLTWAGVDGAAGYDLIVLDAEGTPYWAWSGEATSVFLGGVENPDAIGAWVFEPLTWIVTARDSEGEPLAMSAKAELLP